MASTGTRAGAVVTAGGGAASASTPTRRLRVDFLFLDLTTCTRCRGTDRSLESALEAARERLAATGTDLEVEKIHVASAEQARELRFRTSPTIRINGRDIALEFRESSCGSEACTDGCGDSTACRVWVYGGQEYDEPPPALILDAIQRELDAVTADEREAGVEPYELPENLERFFAGKTAARVAAEPEPAGCCPPAAQRSCCEPEDKAECCGDPDAKMCGCR